MRSITYLTRARINPTAARKPLSSSLTTLTGGGLGLGNVRGALAQVKEHDSAQDPDVGWAFLSSPRTVAVVGAPMQYGQPLMGTDSGPDFLRRAGLREAVTPLGWRYNDQGDVAMDAKTLSAAASSIVPGATEGRAAAVAGAAHNCGIVGAANERLYDACKACAAAGQFVLTLGGDHSIAVGSVAGVLAAHPNLGVVWVDAHADINTPATSGSGNMHGMPVALLLKMAGTEGLPGFGWLDAKVPKLEPRQVAYIGLRDLDDGERAALRSLKEQGMYVSTMHEVDAVGIGAVVRSALESLGPSRPLHLSYDVDALDPTVAPSTGTLVRGGLTYREGNYIAEALAETGRLTSLDLVEVNGALGDDKDSELTAEMALFLVASSLGARIL
mmetsp:Transcript_44248/g.100001  ORF Transcript_44248/g.100001 Transcript_44248/m.100001 type:complete len:386 (-) Transcript_44248:186-1343(-)